MFLSRMNEGVGDAIYDVGKDTVLGLKDLAGGAWELSRLSDGPLILKLSGKISLIHGMIKWLTVISIQAHLYYLCGRKPCWIKRRRFSCKSNKQAW